MDRRLAYVAAFLVVLGALRFVDRFQGQMEQARVETTLRNIRIGLQLAVGEKLMRGEDKRLGELVRANPLSFLGGPQEGNGADGWRFDPATGLLEYRPRHPDIFAGQEALHWRLVATDVGGQPAGLRLAAA